MQENEKVIFRNSLGSVTNQRVICYYDGDMRDIAIDQIVGVHFERDIRKQEGIVNIGLAFSLILGAFWAFHIHQRFVYVAVAIAVFLISSIVFLVIGLIHLTGNYVLTIKSKGIYIIPLPIKVSKKSELKAFVNAIEQQVAEQKRGVPEMSF